MFGQLITIYIQMFIGLFSINYKKENAKIFQDQKHWTQQ